MLDFCTASFAGMTVGLGFCSPPTRGHAFETVQETSLGYAGGKPNPLNPPYQGDFPLNSPLIRGARGVKNDECWIFAQPLSQE